MPKAKSKKQYWAINATSWGIHLMEGTEAQAEEWRAHKANWERCVAWKTEIPKWLYDELRWNRENESAFNVAVHKVLSKKKAEEVIQMKVNLLNEYLKEKF
jgi:hypothetical protein